MTKSKFKSIFEIHQEEMKARRVGKVSLMEKIKEVPQTDFIHCHDGKRELSNRHSTTPSICYLVNQKTKKFQGVYSTDPKQYATNIYYCQGGKHHTSRFGEELETGIKEDRTEPWVLVCCYSNVSSKKIKDYLITEGYSRIMEDEDKGITRVAYLVTHKELKLGRYVLGTPSMTSSAVVNMAKHRAPDERYIVNLIPGNAQVVVDAMQRFTKESGSAPFEVTVCGVDEYESVNRLSAHFTRVLNARVLLNYAAKAGSATKEETCSMS